MAQEVSAKNIYHDEFKKIYSAAMKLTGEIRRLGKNMPSKELCISQKGVDERVKGILFGLLYTPL